MIRRRKVVLSIGLLSLGGYRSARAQAAPALRRVGMLAIGSAASSAAVMAALQQGLAEFGWVDGQNLALRVVYAHGDFARLEPLAGELVAQSVELVACSTPQAVATLHRAAPLLPIVMLGVGNPVQLGFVASLARPGGVITGLSMQSEDLRAKPIQFLHEMLPAARRIGVLQSAASAVTTSAWVDTERACLALGLTPLRVQASEPAQLGAAVQQLVKLKVHAVVVPADGMMFNERARLHALLQAARLPVAYSAREHAQAGGLFSFGTNLAANFRYAAKYVDKILRGAKPADLPVEQPTIFEFVINLTAAKALGIQVPKALLLRADELIQ